MSITHAKRQIRGDKAPAVLHEEAMRVLANNRRVAYESHEFTIPVLTTDVGINDVVDHATECSCGRAVGFLGVIGRAERVAIRNIGTGAILVRYNESAADPITIEDGERHDWDFTEIDDIRFTNATEAGQPVRVLAA